MASPSDAVGLGAVQVEHHPAKLAPEPLGPRQLTLQRLLSINNRLKALALWSL
jgi:hypothetical protein